MCLYGALFSLQKYILLCVKVDLENGLSRNWIPSPSEGVRIGQKINPLLVSLMELYHFSPKEERGSLGSGRFSQCKRRMEISVLIMEV